MENQGTYASVNGRGGNGTERVQPAFPQRGIRHGVIHRRPREVRSVAIGKKRRGGDEQAML